MQSKTDVLRAKTYSLMKRPLQSLRTLTPSIQPRQIEARWGRTLLGPLMGNPLIPFLKPWGALRARAPAASMANSGTVGIKACCERRVLMDPLSGKRSSPSGTLAVVFVSGLEFICGLSQGQSECFHESSSRSSRMARTRAMQKETWLSTRSSRASVCSTDQSKTSTALSDGERACSSSILNCSTVSGGGPFRFEGFYVPALPRHPPPHGINSIVHQNSIPSFTLWPAAARKSLKVSWTAFGS